MTTPTTGSAAPRRTTTAKTPPAGTTTSGAQAAGHARQTSLQQHLAKVAEADVLTPEGLHESMESLRALTSGLAFFVHAMSAQLDAAMRKGARDAADGRLTLADKAKLRIVLRRISRQLDTACSESLLDSARAAVKSWSLMEEFLENLESDQVSRPHRRGSGGFRPGGR